MQGEKKYFEGLNADDDVNLLGETDYINAENIRWGSTNDGATMRIENIGGTIALPSGFALPAGAICIGGAVEKAGRYLVYMIYSPTGSMIALFDIATSTHYPLIEDADIEGGLCFSKDHPIHSAKIINDVLYWTDIVAPRRFNIGAVLKGKDTGTDYLDPGWNYNNPLSLQQHDIALIRKPANYAPSISKDTDATFENNFIRNDSFQFAWQYTYYDGEVSVLSEWSEASLLNQATQDYNFIKVIMNEDEELPQAMRILSLVVKIGSTGKSFVVRLWDKEKENSVTGELAKFSAGTGELLYNFYYNITGPFIDDATSVKPFDSVPVLSGTLEIARNRVFLGDNTEGYDTPATTSLTLTLPDPVTIGFTTLTKNLISIKHKSTVINIYAYSAWYVYLTEVLPVGYYAITATEQTVGFPPNYPTLPAAPTTVAFSGLTFRGADLPTVFSNTRPVGSTTTPNSEVVQTANACDVTGISISTYRAFVPQSLYRGGVVFFDEYMRKCGVVTNDGLSISIPPRDFAFSQGYSTINWTLSNTLAADEIPAFAKYYTPVLTLNMRTRFFIASFDDTVKYATRDADGLYVFTSTTFVTGAVAIAINTTALLRANLGYVFSDGDQCILIDDNDVVYELPVIGMAGEYVLLQPTDIGDTTAATFVYEIYTPYKASAQEPFYARGQVFPVIDPGEVFRTYSTLTGSFNSDAYVMSRNYNSVTYFAEAMSPNDTYYRSWFTDAGRLNIITNEGQRRKKSNISFSNVLLPGTQVNGLSSFEALNEQNLPVEMGAIRRLMLASKAQSEGTVMVAIGENETASVYLGETQIFDSINNSFIAKSDNVIGQVNVLKGSYGTMHPESVVLHKGYVFWFDVNNGAFVRYANNGLFPVSNYKLRRVAKLLADKLLTTSAATIEGFGSRPFVIGGVDNYHAEILWAIPKVSNTAPKGLLIDYVDSSSSSSDSDSDSESESSDDGVTISSPLYPYDIWDQQAKTLVFKDEIEGTGFGNRWMGAYTFSPEWMLINGNDLYSFENGILYSHNDTTPGNFNTFYDVSHRSRIMLACNTEPSKVKSFKSISVEASQEPVFTHIRSEYPYTQSSDLLATDYRDREGMFYAGFYKDRLSPNVTGSYDERMLKGDPMKTAALRILLEFECTNQLLILRFVNILFNNSKGHKT